MRLANSIFRRYGGLAGKYADEPTKTVLMNLLPGKTGTIGKEFHPPERIQKSKPVQLYIVILHFQISSYDTPLVQQIVLFKIS